MTYDVNYHCVLVENVKHFQPRLIKENPGLIKDGVVLLEATIQCETEKPYFFNLEEIKVLLALTKHKAVMVKYPENYTKDYALWTEEYPDILEDLQDLGDNHPGYGFSNPEWVADQVRKQLPNL